MTVILLKLKCLVALVKKPGFMIKQQHPGGGGRGGRGTGGGGGGRGKKKKRLAVKNHRTSVAAYPAKTS